jgi:hypothetical protein
MKYTRIPDDTFQHLQMNAGIIVDGFNPATGGITGNLVGATTGGVQFQDSVTYKDYGEDIDNCPKNMKELKKLDTHAVTTGGTFVTVDADTVKMLVGSADIDALDDTHIIPRNDLLDTDFEDLWWIGDYSDVNTGDNAGFLAIHLMNALNTGGFQIQTGDKTKGNFAFSFEGHYSMDAQDTVPYEIYVKEGSGAATPHIYLNKHSITLATGASTTLTVDKLPANASVTWSSASSSVASVSNGTVTAGSSAGNTIIKAQITVDGVTYDDTCTVIVTAS